MPGARGQNQLFEAALGISKPWSVRDVDFDVARKTLTISVDFAVGTRFAAPPVAGVHPVHDTQAKRLRHLNFFQHECFLEVRTPRVKLPDGRVVQVEPDWFGKLAGFTLLFEAGARGGSLDEVLEADRVLGGERPQVKLGSHRFIDSAGAEITRVATGSTVTLEVDFSVERPLSDPVFGVALFNSTGTCVYATNNREDGVELAALESGGTLRLQYRDIALLPGRYLVTISVFSAPRSDSLIDSLPMVEAFEVESPTREGGLVRLPHTWSVSSRSGISR